MPSSAFVRRSTCDTQQTCWWITTLDAISVIADVIVRKLRMSYRATLGTSLARKSQLAVRFHEDRLLQSRGLSGVREMVEAVVHAVARHLEGARWIGMQRMRWLGRELIQAHSLSKPLIWCDVSSGHWTIMTRRLRGSFEPWLLHLPDVRVSPAQRRGSQPGTCGVAGALLLVCRPIPAAQRELAKASSCIPIAPKCRTTTPSLSVCLCT